MKSDNIATIGFFQRTGRKGGLKRAERLSPWQRSAIASQAAQARWKRANPRPTASVRLAHPKWNDPAYLAEILENGSLNDWRQLYQLVFERPFGETASKLRLALSSNPIYGVTPLWRHLLRRLQNG